MAYAWEQQDGETDAWHANFTVYLGIGHCRTLTKAYKLVHPESTATEVSAAWREEFRARKWRTRETAWDMKFFHEQAMETVVLLGRGMRAFARKSMKALLSKEPAMRPTTWEEAAEAFAALWKMFPPALVMDMMEFARQSEGMGPGGIRHRPEDFDEDGFLKEIPEPDSPVHDGDPWQNPGPVAGEELDRVRTGEVPIYRPERYTPPAEPPPTFQAPTPKPPTPPPAK